METHAAAYGRQGEDAAVAYLRRCGYRIEARNYAWRRGEIDIIASEGPVLVFIEVKARRGDRFGLPHWAVDRHKQRRLAQTAQHYLSAKGLGPRPCRFDVVVIQDDPSSASGGSGGASGGSGGRARQIELIRNAFEPPAR